MKPLSNMDGAGIELDGAGQERGPVSPHCRERGSDSASLRIELLRLSEMSLRISSPMSHLEREHFLAADGSLSSKKAGSLSRRINDSY
ncbi:uncharacterized protein AAGF69_013955 isoform 2-T5 [Amazona ochrocephala]